MKANKRVRSRAALKPMPSSELGIMKTLMGLPTPSSAVTLSKRRPKEDPKRQLAQLMETIIDKLQILALRRPRALIIVAQVLDGLLKRPLDALDDDLGEQLEVRTSGHSQHSVSTTVESRATRGHRGRGRYSHNS